MIVIPALDLKDGRCVRLLQGRMDQESVYSEDPVQMAKHWEAKGAERLHVVDLNGAVAGTPIHRSLIEEITGSIRIPVEVGGGIGIWRRSKRTSSQAPGGRFFGTAALRNPHLLEEPIVASPEGSFWQWM